MRAALNNHGRHYLGIGTLSRSACQLTSATRSFQQYRRHNSSTTDAFADSSKVIFSGIQPTGIPHLGNFLGALQKWVELQNNAAVGTRLIYSIVDLHALTIPHDPIKLRRHRRQMLAMLLAIGLDPNRATIFYQSAVRISQLELCYSDRES
jgi:tryptophanyl-tRNA synthetase